VVGPDKGTARLAEGVPDIPDIPDVAMGRPRLCEEATRFSDVEPPFSKWATTFSQVAGFATAGKADRVYADGFARWLSDRRTFFYCGQQTLELPNRDIVQYGMQGEILDPGSDMQHVLMAFQGLRCAANVRLDNLTRDDPSRQVGPYRIGDSVYWMGGKHALRDGSNLVFGLMGHIAGRGSNDEQVMVRFVGNAVATEVFMNQITTSKPVIPGGYAVGQEVFYCGESEMFDGATCW